MKLSEQEIFIHELLLKYILMLFSVSNIRVCFVPRKVKYNFFLYNIPYASRTCNPNGLQKYNN